jgi:hypothetical protein
MVQRLLLDVTARVFAASLVASAAVSGCAMPAQITGLQFATREGKKPIQRVYRLGVGDNSKFLCSAKTIFWPIRSQRHRSNLDAADR